MNETSDFLLKTENEVNGLVHNLETALSALASAKSQVESIQSQIKSEKSYGRTSTYTSSHQSQLQEAKEEGNRSMAEVNIIEEKLNTCISLIQAFIEERRHNLKIIRKDQEKLRSSGELTSESRIIKYKNAENIFLQEIQRAENLLKIISNALNRSRLRSSGGFDDSNVFFSYGPDQYSENYHVPFYGRKDIYPLGEEFSESMPYWDRIRFGEYGKTIYRTPKCGGPGNLKQGELEDKIEQGGAFFGQTGQLEEKIYLPVNLIETFRGTYSPQDKRGKYFFEKKDYISKDNQYYFFKKEY